MSRRVPFVHGELRRRRSSPPRLRSQIASLVDIDLCAICAGYIPAGAARCPTCLAATRVRRPPPHRRSRWGPLMAGLALAFLLATGALLVVLSLSTPSGSSDDAAQSEAYGD